MNRATMKQVGQALWGPHYRSELARACEVHVRTAMRWDRGETPIPDSVEDCLYGHLSKRYSEIGKLIGKLGDARDARKEK